MEAVNKPEEINFSAIGGDVLTVVVSTGTGKVLFKPEWYKTKRDDFLTLDCIRKQVEWKFARHNTILVIAESYLHGEIYRYGNYGDFWVKIGGTRGYA